MATIPTTVKSPNSGSPSARISFAASTSKAEVEQGLLCLYMHPKLTRRLGGVPFYSDQQTPRAPCPLCTADSNDPSNKDLFFINGSSEGEYDENIPESYFQTPPIDLGGEDDPRYNALLVSQHPVSAHFSTHSYAVPISSAYTLRLQNLRESLSP